MIKQIHHVHAECMVDLLVSPVIQFEQGTMTLMLSCRYEDAPEWQYQDGPGPDWNATQDLPYDDNFGAEAEPAWHHGDDHSYQEPGTYAEQAAVRQPTDWRPQRAFRADRLAEGSGQMGPAPVNGQARRQAAGPDGQRRRNRRGGRRHRRPPLHAG